MKKLIYLWAFMVLSVATSAQAKYQFTDDIRLDCTPVQDQGQSGTCWSFSATSFLESEMMYYGVKNPPNLSEMFIVRQNYLDRAEKYMMLHGNMNFAEGSYSHDNFFIIKKFGIMPESAYPNYDTNEVVLPAPKGTGALAELFAPRITHINHSKIFAKLNRYVDSINTNKYVFPSYWRGDYVRMVNDFFGFVPDSFEYEGKMYTPKTFTDNVVRLNLDDYVQLTSYTHHDFYKYCVLEVPDNWRWGKFFNIPIDELTAIVDSALAKGRTLIWAADISEPGFSEGRLTLPGISMSTPKAEIDKFKALPLEKQIAKARTFSNQPHIEIKVTQESRQEDFLNRKTTDDHGMHIIGTAHDQYGNKFYIVKNSWGDDYGRYNGFFYVSAAYLKSKTLAVVVHKSVCEHLKDFYVDM